jgi:hypothetical protein
VSGFFGMIREDDNPVEERRTSPARLGEMGRAFRLGETLCELIMADAAEILAQS